MACFVNIISIIRRKLTLKSKSVTCYYDMNILKILYSKHQRKTYSQSNLNIQSMHYYVSTNSIINIAINKTMKCILKPIHRRFTFRTNYVNYKFNTIINKGTTFYARKHTSN